MCQLWQVVKNLVYARHRATDQDCFSGEHTYSHIVVVEQAVVEPKRANH